MDVHALDRFKEIYDLSSLINLIQKTDGVVLRKFSEKSEVLTSNFLELLRQETIDSENPIIPIDIPYSIFISLHGKIGAERGTYDPEKSLIAYKNLINQFISKSEDSSFGKTTLFRNLKEATNEDDRNVYNTFVCPNRDGLNYDGPLFSHIDGVGTNLKRLSAYVSGYNIVDFKRDYIRNLHIPNSLKGPRIFINFTELPIIEEMDFSIIDSEIENMMKRPLYDSDNSEKPKKLIDKSILDIAYQAHKVFVSSLYSSSGSPLSIAYPDWMIELASHNAFDRMMLGYECLSFNELDHSELIKREHFKI